MKLQLLTVSALALAACGRVDVYLPFVNEPVAEATREPASLRERQLTLLDAYFKAYKTKDVEAVLATFDDEILGALYPDTVFGRGIAAARPGIEGDFGARPDAYAQMPHRFRLSADSWLAFGESMNGDERAPLWILFDLNEAGDKIKATYTQVGHSGMIEGASVDEPTEAMSANFDAIFQALSETDVTAAAGLFADDAELYAFPPTDIDNFTPVITGANDVASVLAFKWGEGAWRADVFKSQYMQFVFIAIPGGGLDRVALFTFDADPDSPSFEKITRVDVMGPPGG